MTPDPDTEPRRFLEHLYRVAVERALPLHNTSTFLPPPPKGRTVVLGAGKAGGAMAHAVVAPSIAATAGSPVIAAVPDGSVATEPGDASAPPVTPDSHGERQA